MIRIYVYGVLMLFALGTAAQSKKILFTAVSDKQQKPSLKQLPSNLYTQHLGFFCRQEIKMDKQTIIPLRFRMGSMEQCNYLEQKTGYNLPANNQR